MLPPVPIIRFGLFGGNGVRALLAFMPGISRGRPGLAFVRWFEFSAFHRILTASSIRPCSSVQSLNGQL